MQWRRGKSNGRLSLQRLPNCSSVLKPPASGQPERRERGHTIYYISPLLPTELGRRNRTVLIQAINTKYGRHLWRKPWKTYSVKIQNLRGGEKKGMLLIPPWDRVPAPHTSLMPSAAEPQGLCCLGAWPHSVPWFSPLGSVAVSLTSVEPHRVTEAQPVPRLPAAPDLLSFTPYIKVSHPQQGALAPTDMPISM